MPGGLTAQSLRRKHALCIAVRCQSEPHLAVTNVTSLKFCALCDICYKSDSRRRVTMSRIVITTRAAAVLIAIGVILSLNWPQSASATTQMTATVGVNIRSAASTKSEILGGLYRGQTITAISSSHGWTKIKFGGSTAYVASRYLAKGKELPAPKRIGAGAVKITTTALNLRTGPGLS